MGKRMLISGKVPNRKQQHQTAAVAEKELVNVQVQLVGEEKDRFLAYKRRFGIPVSDAAAGKKLMLERLMQVESEAAA